MADSNYKVTVKNQTRGEKHMDLALNVKSKNKTTIKKLSCDIDTSIFFTNEKHTLQGFYDFDSMYGMKTLPDKVKCKNTLTDASDMFREYEKLTAIDLSGLDTSNVTNMSYMFYYCSALTSLDVSTLNTSKVTNMDNMFQACENLAALDVSGFNTSNVTTMALMFNMCGCLESLDVSNFDTSKVIDMTGMFEYCTKLTEINLDFDMTSCEDASDMFMSTENITSGSIRFYNVPVSRWATRDAFLEHIGLKDAAIANKVIVEFVQVQS